MVTRGAALLLFIAVLENSGCSHPRALRTESGGSIYTLASIMANMENEMNNIYRNIDSISENSSAEISAMRLLSLEMESVDLLSENLKGSAEHSTMTNALENAIAQTERLLASIRSNDRQKAKADLDALDEIRRRCHSFID